MRIQSVQIKGFRAFVETPVIPLAAINVLIGANNAGKSSVIRALHLLQDGAGPSIPDVRNGVDSARIAIALEGIRNVIGFGRNANAGSGTYILELGATGAVNRVFNDSAGAAHAVSGLPAVEPNHFIVPFLSKRKTASYNEDVRSQYALAVHGNMQYLAAKLSRISNSSFPRSERYRNTCRDILGFEVTAVPSDGGQRPGIYLPNLQALPIDQMGEGVPNIVALLADLAVSEGKLFLMEEPENDLHPEALKALLELVVESSERNQFVVSTHSNIVLRHLGAAASSKIFEVSSVKGELPPVATIREIESTPTARLAVLRSLGYSFSDFELWDGWLILEESSAERIIRDYLIPWFVPRLTRVRTIAAGGTGAVEPLFEDFNRLVVFSHLENAYRDRAWVRVDGDDSGNQVVERLRLKFPTWKENRFACFSKRSFESFYPKEFSVRIEDVGAVADRNARRAAKLELLNEVRVWLDADSDRGRAALEDSAAEIVSDLRSIEAQMLAK